jgi:nucleotide-binding universal stress UspA family protein
MSYRTILAYADDASEAAPRLQIAANLAAKCGAILDGVFVKPRLTPLAPPISPAGSIPPSTWEALVDSYNAVTEQAETAALASFRSAVEKCGPKSEWSIIEDEGPRGLIGMARCSDLVVVPKSGMIAPRLSAVELAGGSAAPLLLVPPSPASSAPWRKVLVAWNGSREAASALRGAWPILDSAESVEVLIVEPLPEPEPFIGEYLKRHGVHARVRVDSSLQADAGDVIRARAEESGADLVVMGLYSHSRLRELILGGVSKTMLRDEKLCLLVSR